MWQNQFADIVTFFQMRIARENKRAHAHLFISLELRQYLIGRSDKSRATARARTPHTGPKMRLNKPFDISQIAIPCLPRHAIGSTVQGPVADGAAGFIIKLRDQLLRELSRFLLRISHNHMNTQTVIQGPTIAGRAPMYRLHSLAQIFPIFRPHQIHIAMLSAKLDRIGRIATKIQQRATVLLIGARRFCADALKVIDLPFKVDLIGRPSLFEDLHHFTRSLIAIGAWLFLAWEIR